MEQFSENVLSVLSKAREESAWVGSAKPLEPSVFWPNMSRLMDMVHKEVSKLSLAYGDGPKPDLTTAEKMFEEPTKCVLALHSSLYTLHNSSQGQLLVKIWHDNILQLLEAIHEYSLVLLSGDQERLLRDTGNVWELSMMIKSLPTDMKGCYLYVHSQVIALVDDALNELLQAKDQLSNGEFMDEPSSESDILVLTSGIGVVKTAKVLLAKIKSATQQNGHTDTESHISDYTTMNEHISLTSELVDNFAAELYPPSSRDDVLVNLGPLTAHLETLLQAYRNTHIFCGSDNWVAVVENAISHNKNKMEAIVK